jgi:hypothetical protein
MKTLATIAAITLSAISFNAWSQAGDKKEKELDKTQETERARSTQGLRTDNELKDDRGEIQSSQYRKAEQGSSADTTSSDNQEANDEVIEPNRDQGLGSDDDGNNLTNENNTTQGGEKNNNTPAVIQRTSSESGSPAVLSGNNGKERDGTNNVQRATPNIAGAKEPGNMNLSEKNTESKNQNTGVETKIRKEEEVPARIRDNRSKINKVENSATGNVDNTMPQPKQDQQSGELKENVAPEQEQTSLSPKEERKAKRKERRNRRKD